MQQGASVGNERSARFRMTQKERILKMLKESPEGVECSVFAREFLFHKLASRCSELRSDGYDIIRIESHDGEVMKARYKLIGSHQNSVNSNRKADLSHEPMLFEGLSIVRGRPVEKDPFTEFGGAQ